MQIGTTMLGAKRAAAIRVERPVIGAETGIAHVENAPPRKGARGATGAGGHDAIEHVHTPRHSAEQIVRRADTHQIARLVGGQCRGRVIEGGEHRLLALAHGQTADSIALEADLGQRIDGLQALVAEHAALHDAELAITLTRHEGSARAGGPAHGKLHRIARLLFGGRKRRAFVERHGDGGIELVLDLRRNLRGQPVLAAIDMRLERDTFLVELAQPGQGHHLKPAGIRQDRPRPIHHLVQTTQGRHALGARAQHQMIGVAENQLGPGGAHRISHHRLHCARRADRHEDRGGDVAMGGVQRAETGLAVNGFTGPGQAHAMRSSREESP